MICFRSIKKNLKCNCGSYVVNNKSIISIEFRNIMLIIRKIITEFPTNKRLNTLNRLLIVFLTHQLQIIFITVLIFTTNLVLNVLLQKYKLKQTIIKQKFDLIFKNYYVFPKLFSVIKLKAITCKMIWHERVKKF